MGAAYVAIKGVEEMYRTLIELIGHGTEHIVLYANGGRKLGAENVVHELLGCKSKSAILEFAEKAGFKPGGNEDWLRWLDIFIDEWIRVRFNDDETVKSVSTMKTEETLRTHTNCDKRTDCFADGGIINE